MSNKMKKRRAVQKRLWELIEPSIDGYSAMIDRLMSHMTKSQLKKVLDTMDTKEEEENAEQ